MADEMIKDRIVVGVHSDIVRGRLLREKDLCLTKAIDICKAAEASTKQLEKLTDEKKVEILQESRPTTYQAGTKNNPKKTTGPACQNCGRNHPPQRCPAYGKTCNACNKLNHFAKCCRSKPATQKKINMWMKLKHRTILILIVPVKISLLALLTPRHHLTNGWKQLKSTLTKPNAKLTLEPNVLPLSTYQKLIGKKDKLSKSKVKLMSFSGHQTTPEGKITALIQHKNKYYPVEFEVVDLQSMTPILGVLTSQEFGLVKRMHTINMKQQDILNNYPDLFEGLGCLPVEHHIELNERVQPVIHPPRRVPEPIRSRVTKELHRMEAEGVIEKVDQPTDWVNSMVTVIKPQNENMSGSPKFKQSYKTRALFPPNNRRSNSPNAKCQSFFSPGRQKWLLADTFG